MLKLMAYVDAIHAFREVYGTSAGCGYWGALIPFFVLKEKAQEFLHCVALAAAYFLG
jgi:hypothetical protein